MAQDNPYLARSISLTNYAARLAAVAERELCLQWGGAAGAVGGCRGYDRLYRGLL